MCEINMTWKTCHSSLTGFQSDFLYKSMSDKGGKEKEKDEPGLTCGLQLPSISLSSTPQMITCRAEGGCPVECIATVFEA